MGQQLLGVRHRRGRESGSGSGRRFGSRRCSAAPGGAAFACTAVAAPDRASHTAFSPAVRAAPSASPMWMRAKWHRSKLDPICTGKSSGHTAASRRGRVTTPAGHAREPTMLANGLPDAISFSRASRERQARSAASRRESREIGLGGRETSIRSPPRPSRSGPRPRHGSPPAAASPVQICIRRTGDPSSPRPLAEQAAWPVRPVSAARRGARSTQGPGRRRSQHSASAQARPPSRDVVGGGEFPSAHAVADGSSAARTAASVKVGKPAGDWPRSFASSDPASDGANGPTKRDCLALWNAMPAAAVGQLADHADDRSRVDRARRVSL